MSYGQQKLLTLGCCLANDPKLLLLDEPIAGIDEKNKIIIKGIIQKLKNSGITILQIEHDLEYIAETSDFIFQLENRQIKAMQMKNNS
jgi:branched-chain amino acid transport system ATP-binding protein